MDIQSNPPGSPLVSQTPWSQTSAVAAGANTLTQPATAGQKTYVTGIQITGAGATAASDIAVTLAIGGTTLANFVVTVPLGATVGITPLVVQFNPPLVGSAVNQSAVLTVPSFGAGNTNAAANMQGYTQ